MKGLSVVLTALLLFGAEQLAVHLKRSGWAPSRQEHPEQSVRVRLDPAAQHPLPGPARLI